MSTIHFVLTGKGGVGKSFISALLAQYVKTTFGVPFVADTDPSNPTIAGYPAFKAKHINIMTESMNINKSNFDELIEDLLSYEGDCVVDNGSSSFLPIMAYIMENDVIELLREAGKTVIIHAVLIGGLGMDETLRCIQTLLTAQVAPLVVWENELFGPVCRDGKYFVESKLYASNEERILGIVRIVERDQDTFGMDLKMMTSGRLTFDEIKASTALGIMTKQRLTKVRREIDAQLDAIDFEAA